MPFPAILLAAVIAPPQGSCTSGQPTLVDEFAQTIVVVARVLSVRDVQDDPEDPIGISATLYTVDVSERLHGRAAPTLVLRSENTSSRFPMERHRHYLLFIRRARDGALYVDPCGHSDELPQARATLAALRQIPASPARQP